MKVLPNHTGAIIAVQQAALVLYLTCSPPPNRFLIANNILGFVVSLTVYQSSFFKHGQSAKFSTLLILYMLVSSFSKGVLLSSRENHGNSATTPLLTIAFCIKFFFLILESINKWLYLREPFKELPIKQMVGDVNRAFPFWIEANQIRLRHTDLVYVARWLLFILLPLH